MKHPDLRAAGTREHSIPFGEFSPPYRINFGCCRIRLNGYLNVDAVPDYEPDMVCDVAEMPMPFPDGSASEIVMIHLLEHLPHNNLDYNRSVQRKFMADCYRVLGPKGRIQIVGPNIEFMVKELLRINQYLDLPEDPEGVAPAGMDPICHYDATVISILADQSPTPENDPAGAWVQALARHWSIPTAEYIAENLRRVGFAEVDIDREWPLTEVSVMGTKP